MNEVSLKPVIDELETLFSKFNKAFFEGKLEKPVITVSPDHTRGAYGWCTGWKAWQDGTKEGGYYEINLCAEYLNRPFEETCGTLLHEMVHLQNLQDNVQDTSRSGSYHNRKFKETAEAHGLTVEKGEKYGSIFRSEKLGVPLLPCVTANTTLIFPAQVISVGTPATRTAVVGTLAISGKPFMAMMEPPQAPWQTV